MANKLYRHRKYAGSPGDVWKHFIFVDFLTKLETQNLKLVDTHGGDGFYPLHYGASWRRGFGLLDADSIKKTGLATHPYFHHQQTFFFDKKIYLGFWGLCTQIMSNQSNLTLDVFENQREVYEDCQKFLRKYDQSQKIRLFNSSSFDANFSNYDLAFIDPTYRRKDEQGDDWLKVVELCKRLESENCAYLLWYPVYDKNVSFKLWEKLNAVSFEATWVANEEFKYASSGSGILVSRKLYNKLKPNLESYHKLANLLSANFKIHV